MLAKMGLEQLVPQQGYPPADDNFNVLATAATSGKARLLVLKRPLFVLPSFVK